ncbi:MAG TPA: glycosyltransferase [Streptosporangiaceae bacterium]|nr:glycosyltransferase [Streptosporangiaceae bacterium]
MRVLMATFDAGGNVPPFLELGRELVARGDDVLCLGEASLRPRLNEAGITHCAIRDSTGYDPLERLPLADQLNRTKGIMFCDGWAADLAAEISRQDPDALVIDSFLFSAIAVAEKSGIPYTVLVHTLWSWMGQIGEHLLDLINECRQRAALPVRSPTGIWEGAHRLLVTSSPILDVPAPAELPNLRQVGPLFDDRPQDTDGSAEEPDSRPLVLVGFSTTFMAQEEALQRVIDALEGMPVRALVTAGPAVDPSALRAPANVTVAKWARHSAVMPAASAVICHGGHGITSMALAYGKPLLCLPQGRDQYYIADRIGALGAGISLTLRPRPETISEALTSILGTDSYRVKAENIAVHMRSLGRGARNAGAEVHASC